MREGLALLGAYGSSNAGQLLGAGMAAVPTRDERQMRRDLRHDKKALAKQAGGLDANQRAQMLGQAQAQLQAQSRQARADALRAAASGATDYGTAVQAQQAQTAGSAAQMQSQVNQADLQVGAQRREALKAQRAQLAQMSQARRLTAAGYASKAESNPALNNWAVEAGQKKQQNDANRAMYATGG